MTLVFLGGRSENYTRDPHFNYSIAFRTISEKAASENEVDPDHWVQPRLGPGPGETLGEPVATAAEYFRDLPRRE